MKNSNKKIGQEPKGSIELLEEAVELLRRAPLSALAAYYVGSVPFGLGFLYFWADMTRSSLAYQTLSQEAFGVALLFLWMKAWQTVSTRILWNHLAEGQSQPLTVGRFLKILLAQTALQPWGLAAIPIAAIVMLPFAWVYAFFQNATVMGWETEGGIKELYRKSWKLAKLWPRQNNLLILLASGFGILVLSNLHTALYLGPLFLHEFLGIHTVFSQGINFLFNTTYLALTCMLTYLCMDPLMKATYALRCFYGESLYNGEDLKSEIRTAGTGVPTVPALLCFALLAWGLAAPAWSQTANSPAPAPQESARTVKPPELDKAIEETLKGEEYQWQMPRVKPAETAPQEKTLMEKFLDGSLKLFVSGVRKVAHWIDEFFEWLSKQFHFKSEPEDQKVHSSDDWNTAWLYIFLWVLLAVVACALAILLYRLWKRRGRTVVLSQAVMPAPDVADERVSGSELPMDGWIQMAQRLLMEGNYRLALRAFYLASLACLARQKLVTIAKFKSTLDYQRELNRRGHSLPEVVFVFKENGRVFDRGWYGDYEVTRQIVEGFAANHERIRSTVEQPAV